MSYTAFDRFIARQRFRVASRYIGSEARICDLGCGLNPAFLDFIDGRFSFAVGLDYQSFASRNTSHNLIQCDLARGIPLREGRFDHATMLAVLEHLEDPRPTLEGIYRVLTPGGSLIMTWPNPIVDPILNMLHACGLISDEMESDKHQPRIAVAELMSILKEIGFVRFKHQRFELGMNNLLVSWKR